MEGYSERDNSRGKKRRNLDSDVDIPQDKHHAVHHGTKAVKSVVEQQSMTSVAHAILKETAGQKLSLCLTLLREVAALYRQKLSLPVPADGNSTRTPASWADPPCLAAYAKLLMIPDQERVPKCRELLAKLARQFGYKLLLTTPGGATAAPAQPERAASGEVALQALPICLGPASSSQEAAAASFRGAPSPAGQQLLDVLADILGFQVEKHSNGASQRRYAGQTADAGLDEDDEEDVESDEEAPPRKRPEPARGHDERQPARAGGRTDGSRREAEPAPAGGKRQAATGRQESQLPASSSKREQPGTVAVGSKRDRAAAGTPIKVNREHHFFREVVSNQYDRDEYHHEQLQATARKPAKAAAARPSEQQPPKPAVAKKPQAQPAQSHKQRAPAPASPSDSDSDEPRDDTDDSEQEPLPKQHRSARDAGVRAAARHDTDNSDLQHSESSDERPRKQAAAKQQKVGAAPAPPLRATAAAAPAPPRAQAAPPEAPPVLPTPTPPLPQKHHADAPTVFGLANGLPPTMARPPQQVYLLTQASPFPTQQYAFLRSHTSMNNTGIAVLQTQANLGGQRVLFTGSSAAARPIMLAQMQAQPGKRQTAPACEITQLPPDSPPRPDVRANGPKDGGRQQKQQEPQTAQQPAAAKQPSIFDRLGGSQRDGGDAKPARAASLQQEVDVGQKGSKRVRQEERSDRDERAEGEDLPASKVSVFSRLGAAGQELKAPVTSRPPAQTTQQSQLTAPRKVSDEDGAAVGPSVRFVHRQPDAPTVRMVNAQGRVSSTRVDEVHNTHHDEDGSLPTVRFSQGSLRGAADRAPVMHTADRYGSEEDGHVDTSMKVHVRNTAAAGGRAQGSGPAGHVFVDPTVRLAAKRAAEADLVDQRPGSVFNRLGGPQVKVGGERQPSQAPVREVVHERGSVFCRLSGVTGRGK